MIAFVFINEYMDLQMKNLLLQIIKDKRWTQRQLADALGVSQPTVCRLLNDKTQKVDLNIYNKAKTLL